MIYRWIGIWSPLMMIGSILNFSIEYFRVLITFFNNSKTRSITSAFDTAKRLFGVLRLTLYSFIQPLIQELENTNSFSFSIFLSCSGKLSTIFLCNSLAIAIKSFRGNRPLSPNLKEINYSRKYFKQLCAAMMSWVQQWVELVVY